MNTDGNTGAIQYAGFWRRFLATVLDTMLIITLTAPLEYLVYGHGYFAWLLESGDLFTVYGFWDAIFSRLLPIVLIVVLWHHTGATPGKRLMHCKIVDAKSLGPVSLQQAISRLLTYAVSILPFYLGFFWIIWDKRKQGFHDKLAGTVVLYAPDDYATQSIEELMEPSQ